MCRGRWLKSGEGPRDARPGPGPAWGTETHLRRGGFLCRFLRGLQSGNLLALCASDSETPRWRTGLLDTARVRH